MAAAAATIGADIDVPLANTYWDPLLVVAMFMPGAKRSTVVAP